MPDTAGYVDDLRNAEATILFKDFIFRSSTMNKSYLIREADILSASVEKKPNSISLINALKLRWAICLPAEDDWDKKRGKTPIRNFVKELGLELWLERIGEIRTTLYIQEF